MTSMNDEHAPQPPRDEPTGLPVPDTPVTAPLPGGAVPAEPFVGTGASAGGASYDADGAYDANGGYGANASYGADAGYGANASYGAGAGYGANGAHDAGPAYGAAWPYDASPVEGAEGRSEQLPVASATPAPAAGAAAPARRGPGWGGTSALVLAGMLLSSGLTLGGVVAYDQLQGEPVASTEPQTATEARPAATTTAEDPDWAVIAEQVSPSAVSILAATGSGTSQGTGVVLDEDGTVLTNDHVVGDAQSLQVTTSDGLSYSARLVGTDPTTDLAVIRLDSAPEGLQPATFADSSTVVVGQPVMALGTPLGLENTVTTGIVSALDRPVTASGEETDGSDTTFTSAIQTDAAINPGNSGGPLVDAAGQVVGINTAIASIPNESGQAGSIGLGFAIPANTAVLIAEQLQEGGTVQHAFVGVTTTDGTADDGSAGYRGAQVVAVEPGRPAAEAGLQEGDLITGIDDTPVGGAGALTGIVRGLEVGSVHQLEVVRDGSVQQIEITLAARED
jgi:putative serine protease PepD